MTVNNYTFSIDSFCSKKVLWILPIDYLSYHNTLNILQGDSFFIYKKHILVLEMLSLSTAYP